MDPKNDTQNLNESFYRAFEDRFRGSREEIRSRLTVYLPFIEPLKAIYDFCNATDLGCGRGEWLELITEAGMTAHGVDLDDGMLAACRERNLSVETGDAISFLKSLPDQSQAIISGFHIIEHIAFSDLRVLVQEAFRVLKPAGLLILETPNPENIVVSSASFHLDPSHIKPIPPQLLTFLAEYYGFYRKKVLRLQEPFNPLTNKLPNLFHVLYGVSPDYSVVAQKQAAEEQIRMFDTAFDKEYGLSLEKLVGNFDIQVAQTMDSINNRLNKLEVEANNTQIELNNVYRSRSWRITAPLRASFGILHTGKRILLEKKDRFDTLVIYRSRIFLYSIARQIIKFPLSAGVLRILKNKFPRLWIWIRKKDDNKYSPANRSTRPHFLAEDEDHFLELFQRELSRRSINSKTE
jgi:O-antigen chain-terminating methyltransferase